MLLTIFVVLFELSLALYSMGQGMSIFCRTGYVQWCDYCPHSFLCICEDFWEGCCQTCCWGIHSVIFHPTMGWLESSKHVPPHIVPKHLFPHLSFLFQVHFLIPWNMFQLKRICMWQTVSFTLPLVVSWLTKISIPCLELFDFLPSTHVCWHDCI